MAIAAEHPKAAIGPKNPIAPQNAAFVPHHAHRAAHAEGHCGNIGFIPMLPLPPPTIVGSALLSLATFVWFGPSVTSRLRYPESVRDTKDSRTSVGMDAARNCYCSAPSKRL